MMSTKQSTRQPRTDRPSQAQADAAKVEVAVTLEEQGRQAMTEYLAAGAALVDATARLQHRLLVLGRLAHAVKVNKTATTNAEFAAWISGLDIRGTDGAPVKVTPKMTRDAWSVALGLVSKKQTPKGPGAPVTKVESSEVSRVAGTTRAQQAASNGRQRKESAAPAPKGFAEYAAALDAIGKKAGDLPRSGKNRADYVAAVKRLYDQVTG